MTAAPWLDWAVHLVDVAAALPAFVPLPFGSAIAARDAAARTGFVVVSAWIAFAAAAAFALHALASRWLRRRVALIAGTTIVLAMSGTAAVAAGWRLQRTGSARSQRGQFEALAVIARTAVFAVDLTAHRRLSIDEFVSRMRVEIPVLPASRPGARLNTPLATLSTIPAGDYHLAVHHRGGDGWIMACVVSTDRDSSALLTEPIAKLTQGVMLRFPVDVRTLMVRGDEDAHRQVDAIVLRPVRVVPSTRTAARGFARRAARYAGASAFFMDGQAYPEPGGFWVGGGWQSSVVLLPDQPFSSQPLVLRNAPVENIVTLTSGSWRQELRMGPGEERRVDVPIDRAHDGTLVLIRSAEGFRPSDVDSSSRDTRVLGVYVTFPQ